MKQSQLFSKTRKEAPSDEVSKNAQLLIRGGFINKEMAGVYDYLPLGLRVLKKVENIIRDEIDKIGGREVLMTTLQDPELWKKTDRWDDKNVDNWFKTKLATGTDLGIANTHEEPITNMLKHFVNSYKDLPIYVYQFQTKFRNELRAKSGIMRAREFLMKDLYSFNKTEEEFKEFYEKCAEAYMKIFKRVGIGDLTFRTVAGGGSFTKGFTDEFQTISKAGEDVIYIDRKKGLAINKEVYSDETIKEFGLEKSALEEQKAIEIGNIFPLGSKYSDALDLKITDENGKKLSIIMGSYGIGLGRLIGTVVEVLSDEKGIVWPKEVAPFTVHLIEINPKKNPTVKDEAEKFYQELLGAGIEVLWDDREVTTGEKFADSDLIGIPVRMIVSEKTIAGNVVEVKNRSSNNSENISKDKIFDFLSKK